MNFCTGVILSFFSGIDMTKVIISNTRKDVQRNNHLYGAMGKLPFLKEPYPLANVRETIRSAAWLGLFVFAFLFFFRPFGITGSKHLLVFMVSLGFGFITSSSVVILSLLTRFFFKNTFKEQHWTLGLEFLFTLLHFSFIGLFNMFYSSWVFHFPITTDLLFRFQLYTLGVGAFPIAFSIYVRYNRLNQRFLHQALDLNRELLHKAEPSENLVELLTFSSELKEPDFVVEKQRLLYAESADNYVLIHFLENEIPKKHMLRTSLSNMEKECANHPQLLRTHRAFLANLDQVIDFSGNAQGLRLRLKHTEAEIPVSRKMVDSIRKYLS